MKNDFWRVNFDEGPVRLKSVKDGVFGWLHNLINPFKEAIQGKSHEAVDMFRTRVEAGWVGT